jgi:ABC-2 type transport system ATP-binding protein
MSRQPLIRAEHLDRSYGGRRAVADLSFELRAGEIVGFLGLNGAGKSTTMRLLSGNLSPDAGRVLIDGLDLATQPLAARRRVGYLPEHPPLYGDLTVDEYLAYSARLHRLSRAQVREAVRRARRRCGLEHHGRRLIGTLSKGYQQRVGIAQAIVHAPPLLLLDEPTAGLDPLQIREIRQLILDLGRDHGVLLSSHILPEVEATCSRVMVLHEGRLVFADAMGHLERDDGGQILVSLRQAPSAQELAALPGVVKVESLGHGRFALGHQTDAQELTQYLVRTAVERGWELEELAPRRSGLEQVFIELTCSDDAGAHAAVEATGT